MAPSMPSKNPIDPTPHAEGCVLAHTKIIDCSLLSRPHSDVYSGNLDAMGSRRLTLVVPFCAPTYPARTLPFGLFWCAVLHIVPRLETKWLLCTLSHLEIHLHCGRGSLDIWLCARWIRTRSHRRLHHRPVRLATRRMEPKTGHPRHHTMAHAHPHRHRARSVLYPTYRSTHTQTTHTRQTVCPNISESAALSRGLPHSARQTPHRTTQHLALARLKHLWRTLSRDTSPSLRRFWTRIHGTDVTLPDASHHTTLTRHQRRMALVGRWSPQPRLSTAPQPTSHRHRRTSFHDSRSRPAHRMATMAPPHRHANVALTPLHLPPPDVHLHRYTRLLPTPHMEHTLRNQWHVPRDTRLLRDLTNP